MAIMPAAYMEEGIKGLRAELQKATAELERVCGGMEDGTHYRADIGDHGDWAAV